MRTKVQCLYRLKVFRINETTVWGHGFGFCRVEERRLVKFVTRCRLDAVRHRRVRNTQTDRGMVRDSGVYSPSTAVLHTGSAGTYICVEYL